MLTWVFQQKRALKRTNSDCRLEGFKDSAAGPLRSRLFTEEEPDKSENFNECGSRTALSQQKNWKIL